jgi:carbonic anhydrase/acetyltransferase-like protein (isoleucine patch superfamily)
MPIFSFEGLVPKIHETAFIAPTASIIGEVTIEEGASVWYGAVVRADAGPIVVRAGANIQDNAVVHSSPGTTTEIGRGVTVAHLSLIHGAVLEEECLVANGTIVHDGARIGARSLVGAGSVVSAGLQVPEGMLVIGEPAQIKKPIAGTGIAALVAANPGAYRELAQRHRTSVSEV